MDAARFDTLTRSLSGRLTRRRGLALLGGYALGTAALLERADAKKKGKKKKNKKKKTKAPPCAVSLNDSGLTSAVTVKLNNLALTASQRVPLEPNKGMLSTTTVRSRGGLLLQTTVIDRRASE